MPPRPWQRLIFLIILTFQYFYRYDIKNTVFTLKKLVVVYNIFNNKLFAWNWYTIYFTNSSRVVKYLRNHDCKLISAYYMFTMFCFYCHCTRKFNWPTIKCLYGKCEGIAAVPGVTFAIALTCNDDVYNWRWTAAAIAQKK